MLSRFTKVSLLLWMFMQASVVFAQASVEALMEKSGINEVIDNFQELMAESVSEAAAQDKGNENLAVVEKLMVESFQPALMKADFREYLGLALSEKEISNILTWLNTDLGQRIVAMESEASSSEGQQKMMAQAAELMKNSKRVAMAEEYIKVTHTEEQMKIIMGNMQAGMMFGMSASMPEDKRMSFDQITKLVDSQLDPAMEQMKPVFLLSTIFSYQSLTDEELQQYIDFYKTENGQKYNATTMAAFDLAMSKAGRRAGAAIAKAALKKKS